MPVFIVKADATTLAENPSWLVDLHKIYAEMLDEEAPAFIEKTLEYSKHSLIAGLLALYSMIIC